MRPDRYGTISAMFRRYNVSARRHAKLFDQRDGEEGEQMIARQLHMARPFEVGWLFMKRDDEKQRQAMAAMQQARSIVWGKVAVLISIAALGVSIAALVKG